MPVKLEATDDELENVLMRTTRGQPYFNSLRDFLQKQRDQECPVPQRCSVEMMKKITDGLKQELGKKQFQDASAIVSAVQYVTRFQDNPAGLPVLLANGLIDILANAFDQTENFVSHSDGSKDYPTADSLMEVILETVNDVADFSEDAKKEAVGLFTGRLILFIVQKEKKFHVRMESIRTLNLLLEGCVDEVIQVIRQFPPTVKQMALLADLLTTAGDFELQVACAETLARLVKRSDKANYDLIQDWFCDGDFAAAFMKINDDTFETDCRKFLNNLNGHLGNKQSVFSLPCISAHLGYFKLECPTDTNLRHFWVDFNTASRRITMYVADDPQKENDGGGMWETVTIHKSAVEKFRLSERGDRQVLFINLNVPASELLGFCPADDKYAQILFDAKLDVLKIAVTVFGQDKLRQSKHKTSVSQINVQVHIDESSCSPRPCRSIRSADESSDSVSIQNAKIYGLGEDSEEPSGQTTSRSKAPPKHKTSVPHSPMWTPTMARLSSAQGSSVCSSSRSVSSLTSQANGLSLKPLPKKSDFAQPKTPVKPNTSSTKRVKTPLQIVMSDRATDSASESVASYSSSISKKLSVSSGISISSCGTPTRLRQKLHQAATMKLQPQEVTSGFQSDAGSRSDPGPTSSKSFPQTAMPNGYPGQHDGQRSDPGPVSNSESPLQQRRKLRNRVNKPSPAKPASLKKQQERRKSSLEHQRKEQVSSGGETESKTKKPSKKFRLYSDDRGMMMDNAPGTQRELDAVVVIPSSVPSQESVVDVVPDSMPPSGQPPSNRDTAAPAAASSRIHDKPSINPYHPVAHSPLLSTLTEESTQSRTTKPSGEAAIGKVNSRQNMVALQEQGIEVLSDRRVLRSRARSKSPSTFVGRSPDCRLDDKADSAKVEEEEVAGMTSDAGITEIIIIHSDVSPGKGRASQAGLEDGQEDEWQETDIKKTKAADGKGSVSKKSQPLLPSRAFRKVPLRAPESSQDLGQFELTSQMEPRRKRGRPRKHPLKRGGDAVKERPAIEAPTRARSQRAAAKAAQRGLHTMSQSFDQSSDDEASSDPALAQKPFKKSVPAKKKGLSKKSTKDPLDLSIYDFADSESCPSVSMQPRVRKKRSPAAKAAKLNGAGRNALAKNVRPRKMPLGPLLSEEEQLGVTSKRKQSKPSDRLDQSLEVPSDIDDDDDDKQHTGKRRSTRNTNKHPPSPEVLADIEQPRDAAPMTSRPKTGQLSSSDANSDHYCDKDVQSFVESFTRSQRRFLERQFPRQRAADALGELLLESRKSRQDNSGQEARGEGPRSRQHLDQLSNTLSEPSTDRRKRVKTSSKQQTSTRKMPSDSKRSFGVEIVEDESDEVFYGEDPVSISSNDDDAPDAVSVESFSKVCENIVQKSGRGYPARHSNRISKPQPSDEAEKPQQEREDSQAVSSERLPQSNKKRQETDTVSEKSWLLEKPKQKVSTYSKTHSKEWVPQASVVNLDTTSKKPPRKRKERMKRKQREPPAVQRKMQKATTARDSPDMDEDSLGRRLYYYQESESSLSDSKPRLQSAERTVTNKSHRSKRATSTPLPLQSSQEEDKDSSMEIARDIDNVLEYDNPFPMTPLVLEDDSLPDPLPDLVTPKSLKIASPMSSKCSNSSGKTPKQVTFDSNPDYAEDFTPELRQDDPVKSGPSSWVHPTASTLKRKYGDLFSDGEGEEEEEEEEQEEEEDNMERDADPDDEVHAGGSVPHNGQGVLRPKKLFKRAISGPTLPLEEQSDRSSNDGTPSSPRTPTMQIAEMLKTLSKNIKLKVQTKQSQTRQLTEGAVRTTQRRVTTLWSQQHQARSHAQQQFQDNLLAEIVSLEEELGHLQNAYSKLQNIMEQHCRKAGSTLLTNVRQMKSLHTKYEAESRELNHQLGKHLLHSTRQILAQQMANMQKQLIQDTQHQELQQMKKGLQTMFKF